MGKKNKMLRLSFAFLFHLSLQGIHREICVKDFSRTTVPRILQFDTNVGYDFFFIVWKRINIPTRIIPFIYPFSLSPIKILSQISRFLGEPVFKFCIHIESSQVYCETENKTAEIYVTVFFYLSLQCNIKENLCHIFFRNYCT